MADGDSFPAARRGKEWKPRGEAGRKEGRQKKNKQGERQRKIDVILIVHTHVHNIVSSVKHEIVPVKIFYKI